MRYSITALVVLASALFMLACSSGQSTDHTVLSPEEFSKQMRELPSAPILDVRTPEEFSSGHLIHATNLNWNGSEFEKGLSGMNPEAPVFVYCFSGRRSSDAASFMRSKGFKQVYELKGGISNWRNAGLPETTAAVERSPEMSLSAFNELTKSHALLLIDFYAPWCAPCRKMEPFLDELKNEYQGKASVIRIDADANKELYKELTLTSVPVLLLYKENKVVWSFSGYISKEEIVKKIDQYVD